MTQFKKFFEVLTFNENDSNATRKKKLIDEMDVHDLCISNEPDKLVSNITPFLTQKKAFLARFDDGEIKFLNLSLCNKDNDDTWKHLPDLVKAGFDPLEHSSMMAILDSWHYSGTPLEKTPFHLWFASWIYEIDQKESKNQRKKAVSVLTSVLPFLQERDPGTASAVSLYFNRAAAVLRERAPSKGSPANTVTQRKALETLSIYRQICLSVGGSFPHMDDYAELDSFKKKAPALDKQAAALMINRREILIQSITSGDFDAVQLIFSTWFDKTSITFANRSGVTPISALHASKISDKDKIRFGDFLLVSGYDFISEGPLNKSHPRENPFFQLHKRCEYKSLEQNGEWLTWLALRSAEAAYRAYGLERSLKIIDQLKVEIDETSKYRKPDYFWIPIVTSALERLSMQTDSPVDSTVGKSGRKRL